VNNFSEMQCICKVLIQFKNGALTMAEHFQGVHILYTKHNDFSVSLLFTDKFENIRIK